MDKIERPLKFKELEEEGMTSAYRQELFINLVLSGKDQVEAYMEAYEIKSKKWAKYEVESLLKSAEMKKKMAKVYMCLRTKHMATADRTIAELANICFDDISNYVSWTTKEVPLYGKDGKPLIDRRGNAVTELRPVVELIDSVKVDTRNVSEISVSKDGEFKFKLNDKNKALSMLMKHLGMLTEKYNVQIEGDTTVTHKVEYDMAKYSKEELLQLKNLLQKGSKGDKR